MEACPSLRVGASWLLSSGSGPQEVSAEAARLLMQRLDSDGSGTVSFDEWIEG